jgi:peptidoglycan/xylan/chitin deacetylase (PgdA/CDA1 family)
MKNLWAFTVDDVGFDGYSSEKQLNNILDFCDEHKIKSTLFVVPECNGKKIDKRHEYVTILRDAITRGHEIAQHGIKHDRFEIGIPPEMIMILPHEGLARKFLAENRDKLAAEHTVEKISKKLRYGRDILENAIGKSIEGFRSPALQSCRNMFIALAVEEYKYDSSTYLQKAGWDLINGNGIEYEPQKITMDRFNLLQKSTAMREFPLTADYTWYLKKGDFDKALKLAIDDCRKCLTAQIPFVSLCHVGPIHEGDDDLGFELYRRLLKDIDARSLTLSEISEVF